MKKGFTLVELLIVMVIVTVLVSMALPKFKTAMERGRGLEGISNAAAISEALNVEYVKKGDNSYAGLENPPAYAAVTKDENNGRYSYSVELVDEHKVIVRATRNLSQGKKYVIAFVNEDGDVSERYCTGYERYCKALGTTGTRSLGGWYF